LHLNQVLLRKEPHTIFTTYSYSFKATNSAGTVTMSRIYTQATSGSHYVLIVPTLRAASSASVTYEDTFIIDSSGVQIPNSNYYVKTTINLTTTLYIHMTPTSPRFLNVISTNGSAVNRTIILPRASFLSVGTVIFIDGSSSSHTSSTTSYRIIPYGGNMTGNATSATGQVYNNSGNGLTTSNATITPQAGGTNRISLKLVDNSTAGGVWFTFSASDTASNAPIMFSLSVF
jgi:hypothetical protein